MVMLSLERQIELGLHRPLTDREREALLWPPTHDTDAWSRLANQAMQQETYRADLLEAAAWDTTMQHLMSLNLGYSDFIDARQDALARRIRRRKLDQKNIRYRFGFRDGSRPRRPYLVRSDTKAALGSPP